MLNPFSIMPNRKQLIDLVNSIVAEVNQLINGKADKTELDKKLDKTGGNVTGDLSVNGEKVAINSKLSMPSKRNIYLSKDTTSYVAPVAGYLNVIAKTSPTGEGRVKVYNSQYMVVTNSLRMGSSGFCIIFPMSLGQKATIEYYDATGDSVKFICAESEVNQ